MSYEIGDMIIVTNQCGMIPLRGAIGIITDNNINKSGGYNAILTSHLEPEKISDELRYYIKYKRVAWFWPASISPYFTTNRQFLSILKKR